MQLLPAEGAVRFVRYLPFVGLACLACTGSLPRNIGAPAEDYDLYRRTRVAGTLEERLTAAWQYLSDYPEGTYREEVEVWFERVEPAYYASARDSRKRLRRYLDALPKGPHAERASQRILELERGRRGDRERETQALADARRVQDRVRVAAEARSEFVSTIAVWVRRLAAIESWGQRTSELHHEFIHAYRVEEPAAVCDNTRCSKRLTFSYEVPAEGELVAREVVVSIELDLLDGGVERARVSGPALFSRIGEATQRSAIEPHDLQARAEGIGQSARVIGRALEGRLPEASCQREVVSPVVLERACHGLSARMVAAEAQGGNDVVTFEPLATDLGEQADGGPQNASPER